MLVQEYIDYINNNKLENIFIVGSYSISKHLNREVDDLDFSFFESKSRKPFKTKNNIKGKISFHHRLEGNLDFYQNRYYILNLTDEKIFKNNFYRTFQISEKDIHVVIPEIEIAYKIIKARKKDIIDLEFIQVNSHDNLDWELINGLVIKSKKLTNFRKKLLLLNIIYIKIKKAMKRLF